MGGEDVEVEVGEEEVGTNEEVGCGIWYVLFVVFIHSCTSYVRDWRLFRPRFHVNRAP
jgi:hypothetical protein